MIATALAALSLPIAALAVDDLRLGMAVALSLFVAGVLATTIGVLFPWTLGRIGVDPTFGSGPIATVVQDLLSLLVYLVIVSVIAA